MTEKKITTSEMELIIANYFGTRKNIIVPNVSWGFNIHECDLLIIRKSGYLVEIEIKISRADLKKDLKKWHKHNDKRVKQLYFAIPGYMEKDIDLIPSRAGIIIIRKNKFPYVDILRKPMTNVLAKKLDFKQQLSIARLGVLRFWNLKRSKL